MIDYSSFISAFPEFANPSVYSPGSILFWIPAAYAQLSARRFKTQLDLAACLFVAHNVVLSAREAAAAAAGNIVGEVQGPVTAESVDKVSISFSSDTSLEGAGAWNFTTYGQRLFKMMQAYGSGPFYVPRRRRFMGA